MTVPMEARDSRKARGRTITRSEKSAYVLNFDGKKRGERGILGDARLSDGEKKKEAMENGHEASA